MIGPWMLYAAAAGALLALAALALEPVLRALRLPQRWIWLAALALTLAIPAAARWLPRAPEPSASAAPSASTIGTATAAGEGRAAGWTMDAAAVDGALRILWPATSLGMMAVLTAGSVALHRRRRKWRAAEVDGVGVLLSADTGPAVVGIVRSRIVLPAWVMEVPAGERALLLEHEREHQHAGDPLVLALALGMVAAAPWNPAAWFGLRRLRLAMEVDCDARVLARRGDVRAYGALLLEAGRRAASTHRPLATTAFGQPVSFLERRIRIMSNRMQRPRARVVIPALALCAAAIAGMRALPAPAVPPAAAQETPRPATSIVTGDTVPPRMVNSAAVVRALDAAYPPLLRDAGIEGEVTVRMTVTAEGAPAEVAAVRSTHPELAPAAVRAMRTARFHPAESAGAPVPFTLELPVRFSLPEGEADGGARTAEWDEAPELANAGEMVEAIDAAYPRPLRDAGIRARVQVRLRVSETGEVTEATATSASHPEAGAAAERALLRARFRPARKDGVPIAVHVDLPIVFEVPRPAQP
jgi:TonB family protein